MAILSSSSDTTASQSSPATLALQRQPRKGPCVRIGKCDSTSLTMLSSIAASSAVPPMSADPLLLDFPSIEWVSDNDDQLVTVNNGSDQSAHDVTKCLHEALRLAQDFDALPSRPHLADRTTKRRRTFGSTMVRSRAVSSSLSSLVDDDLYHQHKKKKPRTSMLALAGDKECSSKLIGMLRTDLGAKKGSRMMKGSSLPASFKTSPRPTSFSLMSAVTPVA